MPKFPFLDGCSWWCLSLQNLCQATPSSGSLTASLRVPDGYCTDSQVTGSGTVHFWQCFLAKEEEEDEEEEDDEDEDDEEDEDEDDEEETGIDTSDKEEEQDSEEGKQLQWKQQMSPLDQLWSLPSAFVS